MSKLLWGTIRVVAGALAFAGAASASTTTVYLDQSNATPPFPDGSNYLQLTIMDGSNAAGISIGSYTTTSSDVVFTMATLPVLDQYANSNGKYGLDEFAFNTTLNLSNYSSGNFVLPSNWSVGIGSANADGFGAFELIPQTSGSNHLADPLTFAIKGVSSDALATYFALSTGNAGQGNFDFAAHVIGLSIPGYSSVTSVWFGGPNAAPVPLPAAGWLMLVGFGVVSSSVRKKSRS
jgi:hypothetical protein